MYVTNVLLYLANFISLEMEDLNIHIGRTDVVSQRFSGPRELNAISTCLGWRIRTDILRSG